MVGLYNGNGELVAKYDYDTWGKVKSVKDASGNGIIDQNHVGNLNPFRYRGYYYDKETQLYYLMSRYYDPVTHRFLNADGYFKTGDDLLDTNMNVYCKNNPVNCFDPTGEWCHALESGRMGPMCPVNMVTGYCSVCHSWDCCKPPKKPNNNNTTNTTPKQDKFNTGENISNAFVGGVKTAVNVVGKNLDAAGAATLSGTSYAVTAPVAMTFHWINPSLTNSQKWILTGMEALNAVGGVLLAFSIANCWNPFGWGGVAVSLMYSTLTFLITSAVNESFIEENRRNGII